MLGWLHLASSGASGLKMLSVKPAQCLRFQLLQCFRHFMSLFWGRERNHSKYMRKRRNFTFLRLRLDGSLKIFGTKTEYILQVCVQLWAGLHINYSMLSLLHSGISTEVIGNITNKLSVSGLHIIIIISTNLLKDKLPRGGKKFLPVFVICSI